MILGKIDHVMAEPHFVNKNFRGSLETYGTILGDFVFWSWHNRKWQDYVYIQCEYKSTKQKIKHLLREENKVKENKIS